MLEQLPPASISELCFLPAVNFFHWTCMTRSEWASWFQAIASVAAILIAVAIPAAQHRFDTRMRVQEAHAKTAASLRTAYYLAEDIQRWLTIFHVNESQFFDSAGVQSLRDRLASIDLQSLPPTLADRIAQVWFTFVQITACLQVSGEKSKFDRSNDADMAQITSWRSGAGQLSSMVSVARGDFDRITRAWPTISPKDLLDVMQNPPRDRRATLSPAVISKHLKAVRSSA